MARQSAPKAPASEASTPKVPRPKASRPKGPSAQDTNTSASIASSASSVALSAEAKDPPRRWQHGLPHSPDFYYDEDLPARTLNKTLDRAVFPPRNMDMSDAWVVKILKADFTGAERHAEWPAVFASKYLNKNYLNKGRASKVYSMDRKKLVYSVGMGIYQFHGSEGVAAGLSPTFRTPVNPAPNNKCKITEGADCVIQDEKYNPTTYPPPSDSTSTPSTQPQAAITPLKLGTSKRRRSVRLDLHAKPIGDSPLNKKIKAGNGSEATSIVGEAGGVLSNLSKKARGKLPEMKEEEEPIGILHGIPLDPDVVMHSTKATEDCVQCTELRRQLRDRNSDLAAAEGKVIGLTIETERIYK